MTHDPRPAPGRRSARRAGRLDLTTLAAVLVPVLCAVAVLLVRPSDPAPVTHPPTRTPLTRATLACPSAMPDGPEVAVTSAADGVRGRVAVGLGDRTEEARLVSGRATTVVAAPGPVAVTGEDESAPGLVAARFGSREPAAVDCAAPAPQVWFTGVGAGAGHTSVLELVNPDAGTAIADITVHGRSGVVDAPRLRGVSVPGSTSVRLDLASIVPRRDELTIEVVASRGRIGAAVLDRLDPVGGSGRTQDWLPAQAEPATSNLLMGLAPGTGPRTLVVANGGDDEIRARVRLVSEDSVFAPRGLPEIRVAPQSVARVRITSVVAAAVRDGALGMLVTATGPVTATVRSYAQGDLSHAVPGDVLTGSSTALLPPGGPGGRAGRGGRDVAKSVQLAGATRSGVVVVVARSAAGAVLDRRKSEVAPERGVTVRLPRDTALVSVTPSRTSVSGAVLVTGGGAAVLPLRLPVLNGLVAAVRPGLP